MAIEIEAFTGTATIGTTEHSLTANAAGPVANTTVGVFQPFVDLNALTTGDVYRLSVYEKCRTGGTQRLVYAAEFSGAQAAPLSPLVALFLGIGWDITLKKVAGTDRAIAWRISGQI